jgi:hypothetical protein
MLMVVINVYGQTTMPDELNKSNINEQIKYLEEHTRIYENYRAVREDMFQKINRNFTDTLSASKSRIDALNNLTSALSFTRDSLNTLLGSERSFLDETIRTKNSIKVLGMEINKTAYNTIMWTIILVLTTLLVIGFLVFKRNMIVTIRTKKELDELKKEFEGYRQTTRIAREKAQMDHFNEIKKLKGT